MLRKRAPFTRLLAALTPALLLWAFVGCVAVCAAHAEEGRGDEVVASSSAELRDSHCPDRCPVTEASFVVPAKRLASNEQSAAASVVPAPAEHGSPRAVPLREYHARAFKPPDPPLERLPALRI